MKKCHGLFLLALLALGGCSGEPGEGAMEKAVASLIQEAIGQSRQFVQSMGGSTAGADLKDFEGFERFEKIGCKPDTTEGRWICQFRFTATLNGKTETATESGRFYQTDRGWQAEMTDE